MNQDLKNYIDQARAAGKNDETIKQELRSTGWQESDISEAFGATPASVAAPVTAAAAVSGRAFPTKVVAISAVVLLLLAAGAYMAFGRNGGTNNDNSNNASNSNNTNSDIKACKDLLPGSKFTEITGITDFEIHESGRDTSVTGLNQLPGNPGTGDAVVAAGIQQQNCGYVYTNEGRESSDISMKAVGDSAIGSDILFSIVWGGAGASQSYELLKQTDLDFSKGKEATLGGESFTIPPNPDMTPVEVSGVGSAAYFSEGMLTMLSSNEKYMFHFIWSTSRDVNLTKEQQMAIAKVVDSNLK